MIRRVVALIGTARPSPMPAIAVLMPTTRPRPLASAPPELPGLRAASVWITFSMIRAGRRPAGAGRARPRAETTPAVTEPSKPCGLPIATTSWPTRSSSASPSSAGASPPSSARTIARSESGSRPRTEKRSSRPSVNAARPPLAGAATTCAEVRMKPSCVRATPLPAPTGILPRRVRRWTRRLATAGARLSATPTTARE